MKNRAFSTIIIVLLFTLAFLLCFRACVGAIEGNLDGGNVEIIEGADNPSVADDGDNEETVGAEPPSYEDGSQEEAEEGEEEFDLKAYVEDRIVPVISGVGAAIVAILVALGPLISAIKAIKNAAASFSKKDEERNASQRESNKIMQKSIERIEKNVEDVTKLQAQIDAFKKQTDELKLVCATLAKITALGFQSNADVVRSGKGKKMAVLLNKIANITDEGGATIPQSLCDSSLCTKEPGEEVEA